MPAPADPADPVAVLCQNLKRWQERAPAEGWQPDLDRITTAALSGTLTASALTRLLELSYSAWLISNQEQLRATASEGGWRTQLESILETVSAGASTYHALRSIGLDLETQQDIRRPQWSGSGQIFADDGLPDSDFVCPRKIFRCGRRERRGPSGQWPTCALREDQPLTPMAARRSDDDR